MRIRRLCINKASLWWTFAAASATLAEFEVWYHHSGVGRQWLWLMLGGCVLALAWIWRTGLTQTRTNIITTSDASDPSGTTGVDPALAAIREIWIQEGIPRIVVDAKHEGVLVPGHVRDRWGHQLVIDLDPRYPLRLEVSYEGCAVDLSFGGEVSRCVFAWPAIYTVQNRGSGDAVVIEARVPKEIHWG